ncbi:MAG: radical SAM protein [Candidatus Aureabacteria bacterium]|nr:radical SAM protein [Candidatus Auribacterota bacterium]
MINITRLICGGSSPGDTLRYPVGPDRENPRPVVVWNTTRRCTLSCIHCYSDSHDRDYPGELSTSEAERMIDDLGACGIPVLLFSGGEPLLRTDLFALAKRAKGRKIRTVLSTNGVLITPDLAKRMRDGGFDYVGVSIDGIGENNDRFRGKRGAFDCALRGIRSCLSVGQNVGVRFTVTRHNLGDLEGLIDLVEREGIRRICFYHLVYAGRGGAVRGNDLTHEETRRCVDRLSEWAASLAARGVLTEVLTVDNHADGPYIYMKLQRENPSRAKTALDLLHASGGNRSGIGIANVDSLGNVHPDQFLQSVSVGNVRERKFSELWRDAPHEILRRLRDRQSSLKGRCARCRFLDICNGNFRARAEAVSGDLWGEDPACYLTDKETMGD